MSTFLSEQDYENHSEKEWNRLPQSLKLRGINILKDEIPTDLQNDIRDLHKKHGSKWIIATLAHFTFGMRIRNKLRLGGLTDNLVSSGNLDDYYVQLIEATIGVRI